MDDELDGGRDGVSLSCPELASNKADSRQDLSQLVVCTTLVNLGHDRYSQEASSKITRMHGKD